MESNQHRDDNRRKLMGRVLVADCHAEPGGNTAWIRFFATTGYTADAAAAANGVPDDPFHRLGLASTWAKLPLLFNPLVPHLVC